MTRTDELRSRLLGTRPTDRLWGWLGPGLIALVGGVLRFWNLDRPHALVFDETYYVKQAYSLLHFGVEMRVLDSLKKPDEAFVGGSHDVFSTDRRRHGRAPARSGKWLIAVGEWLFGADVGVGLAVLGRPARHAVDPRRRTGRPTAVRLDGARLRRGVPARVRGVALRHVAHRRSSTSSSCSSRSAGSRRCSSTATGAARSWPRRSGRCRAAAWPAGMGPWLGWRPWRWVAGLSLGLCYRHEVVGPVLPRGVRAHVGLVGHGGPAGRRGAALGARRPVQGRAVRRARDGRHRRGRLHAVVDRVVPHLDRLPPAVAHLPPRRGRAVAAAGAAQLVEVPPGRLRVQHDAASTPHPYQSNPWSWMVQTRPTSFFYESPTRGVDGCTVEQCSQAINPIGTISVWWLGILALLVVLWWWLVRRDWRAGAIAAGFVGGYLPWFVFQDRTIYTFYAVAFEPWVVLAVVFAPRAVRRPARGRPRALAAAGGSSSAGYLLLTLGALRVLPPRLRRRHDPVRAVALADVVHQLDLSRRPRGAGARRVVAGSRMPWRMLVADAGRHRAAVGGRG